MKIILDLPDTLEKDLQAVVRRCTTEASTHGSLTLESLFEMLAEDLAMTVNRPGSWEASNMAQVFQSHGYSL